MAYVGDSEALRAPKLRRRVTDALLFRRDAVKGRPDFPLVKQLRGFTRLIPCLRRSKAIKALSKLVQPLRALVVLSLDIGQVCAFRVRPRLGGHLSILIGLCAHLLPVAYGSSTQKGRDPSDHALSQR